MARWVWLLLIGYSGWTPLLAQCPARTQLYETLQKISAIEPIEKQPPELQKWLTNWQTCYPKTDSTYVSALIQLSLAEFYQNEYLKAVAIAKQVIPLYQQTHTALKASDLVKACYRIGVYYTSNENNAEAITYLQQAIKLGMGHAEASRFVASSHLYLIYAYFVKGDFEKALTHADLGGNVAMSIGSTIDAAKIWEQKAQVLYTLHRNKEARIEVEKALRLLQNQPAQWVSVANQHRLLSDILQALNLPNDALNEGMKAYQLAEKNQYENLSDFLNPIGYHYYQQGNYKQAISYYQRGLQINKSQYSKIVLYNNLGLAYAKLKQYPQAFQYYQQGFSALLSDYRASTLASVPEAQTIRRIAQKDYLLSLIHDKADTWLDWAKNTGNNPARLRNAQKTYALADSMIDFMRWEHTGQQSKLFWREKTHRLYESAIETCFRLKDAANAFRFIEKSRAVLLNDKLNELGANRQLSPTQIGDEESLRKHVTEWQTKLLDNKPNTPAYAKVLDSLHTTQEQQEAFVKQLEQTNPAYYRYKYDNNVIALAQVQEQLANRNASLVTYFVGDSTLFALGITPTDTKFLQLATLAYTKPASELLALNANPDAQNQQFATYLNVSNKLYQQLLAPLALKPGRVIVSPDGVLLPFDALSASATRPDFLVNRYAFSYAYSLNRLFKESTTSTTNWFSRSGTFLGVAPVQFSTSLNQVPLVGSDEALQRIGSQFSAPALLTGRAATRLTFGQQAGQYRVIQLFTHAEADTTGLEPALFFADSALRLSELTTGSLLPTELVGLSACKTGIGANQRGEGVFSLARGFASLGVPSVLTTLWNVENQATYDLTERFYAKLAEGLPKDIALQQAKLDYLASVDLSGQLPTQWAGLLVVGDAEPLKKSMGLDVWGISLGAVMLVGGWWWFRRRKQAPRSY